MTDFSMNAIDRNDGATSLSGAGRARRDAMLPMLQAELRQVQIRRVKRQRTAATVAGVIVFALLGVAALQWAAPAAMTRGTSPVEAPSVAGVDHHSDRAAPRSGSSSRSAIVIVDTTSHADRDDRSIIRTPGPSRTQIVTTDASSLRAAIVDAPPSRVSIINDDELVEHLARAGYPAALIRTAGRARIAPIGWDAGDWDAFAAPGG